MHDDSDLLARIRDGDSVAFGAAGSLRSYLFRAVRNRLTDAARHDRMERHYVDMTYLPVSRRTTLATAVGVHIRPDLDVIMSLTHPVALTPLGAPVLIVRKHF